MLYQTYKENIIVRVLGRKSHAIGIGVPSVIEGRKRGTCVLKKRVRLS